MAAQITAAHARIVQLYSLGGAHLSPMGTTWSLGLRELAHPSNGMGCVSRF